MRQHCDVCRHFLLLQPLRGVSRQALVRETRLRASKSISFPQELKDIPISHALSTTCVVVHDDDVFILAEIEWPCYDKMFA